jgi:hypothetical protein
MEVHRHAQARVEANQGLIEKGANIASGAVGSFLNLIRAHTLRAAFGCFL